MTLEQLLREGREEILAQAVQALERAGLPQYAASLPEENAARLKSLLALVEESVSTRALLPIVQYAEGLAEERYIAGFPLQEVQVAFNVLEEAIWHRIAEHAAPEALAEAFGLATTVLGAGKEALAVRYVELATRGHVASLDLTSLFQGA